MSTSPDQRGFSLVEGLLVIIAVTLIGFTGFYVYSNSQSAEKTAADTAKSVKQSEKTADDAKPAEADPSASWLLYTSPGKEFSVRLADGWKLSRYQESASLGTFSNDAVALKPGTPAKVTQIEMGRDGPSGFFLNYFTKQEGPFFTDEAVKVDEFKTDSGLTVEKYQHTETRAQVEGLGQLDQGGVYYNYVIQDGPNRFLTVSYSVQPEQTHHFKTVESVLRTVRFN